MAIFAYHENGAVGVPYDRAGDASHKRPPDAAQAPATHDYQAGVQLLTELDYLLIRPSKHEVRVLDLASFGFYALGLLIYELPGVVLVPLDADPPPLPGVWVWVGQCLIGKQDEEDVELRAGGVGYLDGGPGGEAASSEPSRASKILPGR